MALHAPLRNANLIPKAMEKQEWISTKKLYDQLYISKRLPWQSGEERVMGAGTEGHHSE